MATSVKGIRLIRQVTLTSKQVTYALVCSFLAWMFSVYDYILFGTLLPVIAQSFHWSTVLSLQIATWVSVGTFILSFLVGPMTDYLGRKNTLMITTFGAAISSGLTALTMNPIYLIFIRALSGLGYSEQAVNTTYLTEIMGPGRRGFLYSFVQGGWPIGVLFASLMTAVLEPHVGWRGTFLVATFPAIVIVILWSKLQESPRFEQMKQVRQLLRKNRVEEAHELAKVYEIDSEKMTKTSLLQMFDRDTRKHTLFLCIAYLLNWMAIQVFSVLSTTVLVEGKGISFTSSLFMLILSNAVAYIGYVTHGYVGDKIGRRETIIMSWVLGSLFYAIMLFLAHGFLAVIVTYTLGLFFLIGSYSAVMSYISESFPTRMRGTAASVVNSMGPLGGIVGSAVFAAVTGTAGVTSGALVAGALPMLLSGVLMIGARRIRPGQVLESISK
ncbi:MFS transporter [Alicyclobacillus kakegawensis]|uniref:MFS transporter n=1 Tax=Alicyclobacillus kakegawensis TaxID=392012 RepID=UPI00082D86BA|nr:MFS transporter [Alicyclobacillus kakegawensis]